jgi:Mn-dependent DtxR family transcriptional regulator
MPSVICQYHLDSLSDIQKIKMSRQFNESGKNAMPHQIAGILNITYSEALTILVKLEANGLCEMKLLILPSQCRIILK